MTARLDDLINVLKTLVTPADFKDVGVLFLREHFGRYVHLTDGKGDGGVDAWVIAQSVPQVRWAAQFHAGKSVTWQAKLEDDLKKMCKFRDSLKPEDPKRHDFRRLFFVTSQELDETSAELAKQDLEEVHSVNITLFQAKSVASQALTNRSELWRALVRLMPGYAATEKPSYEPRDEALLAFSFFHEKPEKYRAAVTKSAIGTVLHRHGGESGYDELIKESASLLQLKGRHEIIPRTVRHLEQEAMLKMVDDTVRASVQLTEGIRATLTLAENEKKELRAQCVRVVEPLIPKGTHHRSAVAERAVDGILDEVGLLVRFPIAEQIRYSVDPAKQPRSRYERDVFKKWKLASRQIEAELEVENGPAVIEKVVEEIAQSPFAKRLAAAELFLSLTEHDAVEFSQALTASSQCVLLDTSVALPMFCAIFDAPVRSWQTSAAAYDLYQLLKERNIRRVIPSVYLEEMASHVLNARDFAEVIDTDADVERSRNYLVAHFSSLRCGERRDERTKQRFLDFLDGFGAPKPTLSRHEQRTSVEREIRRILETYYGIEIEYVPDRSDNPVPSESSKKEPVLQRHDQAVVQQLQAWAKGGPSWLVCTADRKLRITLNELDIVAVDNVGLIDLLELVKPSDLERPLHGPMELAMALGEQERELAASVWDAIVAIEGSKLSDNELMRKARVFRNAWLQKPRDDDLHFAWTKFRDASVET